LCFFQELLWKASGIVSNCIMAAQHLRLEMDYMKNRAGLLALIVLAIASLLMIFVVMPFLKGDRKPVDDIAKVAADATKVATDTVTEAGKAATDAVADVAKQVSGDTPAEARCQCCNRRTEGPVCRWQAADRRSPGRNKGAG